jgi:hypothetical protein
VPHATVHRTRHAIRRAPAWAGASERADGDQQSHPDTDRQDTGAEHGQFRDRELQADEECGEEHADAARDGEDAADPQVWRQILGVIGCRAGVGGENALHHGGLERLAALDGGPQGLHGELALAKIVFDGRVGGHRQEHPERHGDGRLDKGIDVHSLSSIGHMNNRGS